MNPIEFKDITAVIPVLSSVFTFQKDVRARDNWTRLKTDKLGNLGRAQWWIDYLPNKLYLPVNVVTVVFAVLYLTYKIFYDQADTSQSAKFFRFFYDYYMPIFVAYMACTALGYFNFVSLAAEMLAGLFPSVKRSIGFANASWHRERGDTSFAVSVARNPRPLAEEIVYDLVTSPRNKNLALRPPSVNDGEAANILLFGHVVEQYYSDDPAADPKLGWTRFYEIMGLLASQPDHPFSPASMKTYTGRSFFYDVLKRFDTHVANGEAPLPASQQLEEAVDRAFARLRDDFAGDARNLAKGLFNRYSYQNALSRSRSFLPREDLPKQFAKLSVVWNFLGHHYQRPEVFRIPFSRGILLLLLEKNFLLTDAEDLNLSDRRLLSCTEEAQHRLLSSAFDALERTQNAEIVAWREDEKRQAVKLGIDWKWYALYRLDQHTYHMGRVHTPMDWDIKDAQGTITKKKKK